MHFEKSIVVAAPREAVWSLISDTDRLNREMKLPPILFTFRPRESGGADALATIRIAGFTLQYNEHPFEWVRPAWYRARRTFPTGPIREISGGARLESIDGGTRITVFSDLEPANGVGILACKAVGTKANADFISACRRFEPFLTRSKSDLVTAFPRGSGKPPADRDRLRQKVQLLRSECADDGIIQRIAHHIANAPPEDAAAMRPFVLADKWGEDRIAVLKAFLIAASRKVGLVELRWRVLCPVCRGGPAAATGLAELKSEVHCEACNIRFDAEFDQSVEVCFNVSPAIRPIRETTYCVGGPGRAPFAAAQLCLGPGESRTDTLSILPGRYALTGLQIGAPLPITIDDSSPDAITATIRKNGARGAIEHTSGPCVNREATWTVVNKLDSPVVLKLEDSDWKADAATAALVTSLQTFRDQFSSEVLAPGAELAVRQICVLFSDLKASTAMYYARGDAPSYRTVRAHFELMRRVIEQNNGAVVKTIGDAVMATFHDPADGVTAALAIQREASIEPDHPTVKLGLHYGPAIAVNANDNLDYFGHTVNMAARIQSESEGGDIVVSSSLARDPKVAGVIRQSGFSTVEFETSLRGIDEPVKTIRLNPPPQTS